MSEKLEYTPIVVDTRARRTLWAKKLAFSTILVLCGLHVTRWFLTLDNLVQDPKQTVLETLKINLAGDWSKKYTSEPHLAGTNFGLVQWTADKFEEYGFKPTIDTYEIYVSYPNEHDLNLIKDEKVVYKAPLKEDVLKEDKTTQGNDTIPTFLGYAANGNVTAEYVYVNYGTIDDFAALAKAGVDVKGKIAVARYGSIFRGLKVKFAQDAGAVGVLLYSDPGDDDGITPANGFKQYPHGPARQESSVQRGSVQFLGGVGAAPGDPTTPGYASKPGVDREDPHSSIGKIPVLPISYREVKPILEKLNGHGSKPLKGFSGELEGFDYSTGPNPKYTLNLYNDQIYNITTLYNVYGEIEGENKDEVIIIGNHRDAWIKGGAGDPNSGSAALIEVARALGSLKAAGYKFKRTIVLQSFDGEEYGLLGSTEQGEYFADKYKRNVVAYINVDVAVSGKHFHASATPSLNEVLFEAAKELEYPEDGVGTLYDHWFKRNGAKVGILGSGSDYTVYLEHLGIPSVDLGFTQGKGDPIYHYHSNYDSYHWISTSADPGFVFHNLAAKYLSFVALKLSEREVIPLHLKTYAHELQKYYKEAISNVPDKWLKQKVLGDQYISYNTIDFADENFVGEASNHHFQAMRFCPHNKMYLAKQRMEHWKAEQQRKEHGKYHKENEEDKENKEDAHQKEHGKHHKEHGKHHKEHEKHHKEHGKHHKEHEKHHKEKREMMMMAGGAYTEHKKPTLEDLIESTTADFDHLLNTTSLFDEETADLQFKYDNRDTLKFWQRIKLHFQIKHHNKLVQYFERNFLHEEGLYQRPWFKHIVVASGRFTGYAGQTFPGLKESVEDGDFERFVHWLGIVHRAIKRINGQLVI